MAEDDIKDHLAGIRQRIHQKKDSARSLTGIFEGAKQETRRKEPAKISAVIRSIEEEKRILGAVSGYFEIITPQMLDRVENQYPITVSFLFEISKHIVQGDYGLRLQADGRSDSDIVLNSSFILEILIIHLCKQKLLGPTKVPEILESINDLPELAEVQTLIKSIDVIEYEKIVYAERVESTPEQQSCRKKIDAIVYQIRLGSMEQKVFVKIFRRYLDNIANPSSAGVTMLLKNEKHVDNTVKQVFKIKNTSERTKSIGSIVDNLLGSNNVGKAIQVVRSIKAKKDLSKPLTNLVKQLLNPKRKDIETLIQTDQIDEAISMADSLINVTEKDKIYQRLVSGLAMHKKVDIALEVANKITDPDVKDFSLSSLVSGLIGLKDFHDAIKVASLIVDSGYRDDANSYIVRGILETKSFEEAVSFVDSLRNPLERSRAAKVILSWARSNQDQNKVEEVSAHFELVV